MKNQKVDPNTLRQARAASFSRHDDLAKHCFLCSPQSVFWHSAPQYRATWQRAQRFRSLTLRGLERFWMDAVLDGHSLKRQLAGAIVRDLWNRELDIRCNRAFVAEVRSQPLQLGLEASVALVACAIHPFQPVHY